MYKTPYCGYCVRAAALLKAKGVACDEVDISMNHELRAQVMEASGHRTVPQIFINGQSIGGFQELAALERSGALDRMLA
jgi:glutaredoxin 3